MKRVVTVLLALLAAAPAVAGWLVDESARVCYGPVAGPPGIGLGSLKYADACPSGYAQAQLPQAPKPWWQSALEQLDTWFGLSRKVLWVPTLKQLAVLTMIIAILRHGVGLSRWVSGPWTIVLSAILSVALYIQGAVTDGSLTLMEAILAVVTTVAGSAGLWEAMKRLVRRRLTQG
jgi:hypothetical protein